MKKVKNLLTDDYLIKHKHFTEEEINNINKALHSNNTNILIIGGIGSGSVTIKNT